MLGRIAFEFLRDDALFFERDALLRKIQEYLSDILNAPGHLDAQRVLDAIEQRQGLLSGLLPDPDSLLERS